MLTRMSPVRCTRYGTATLKPLLRSRHLSSAPNAVPLAYTTHPPPPDSDGRPPIVILHGLFGSKQTHRSISNALAREAGCTVYALDLRNHGDSPHVTPHDYRHMAADVEEFLTARKLGSDTVLIGHSMGAKTAMALGLRRPELVSKLVIVDNAPVEATLSTSFAGYLQGMRKVEDANVTKQAEADEILKGYEENLTIRQFLLTNLKKTPASPYLRWRVPVRLLASALDEMGGFPYHPDKVRFEKPALFVRGSQSHYVSDEVIPLIGRFFPLFRLVDIDCGHWVISEKPHDFKRAVLEFLDIEKE